MNNCLSASQLYDREYLFYISMPNKISVSDSLSHTLKEWENLKLTLQRCKEALPNEDIDDPSAVFKCTAAGSILVLQQSSMIFYMLVWAYKRAAPESIRAFHLFPACTVTVGQSGVSPIV